MSDKAYPAGADGKPYALEQRGSADDGRRFSPSIARNRDVIRDVLLKYAIKEGHVLEIASGTGEHGAHITAAAPQLYWTYSDYQWANADSQKAWAAYAAHGRLQGPHQVDASAPDWGDAEAAAPCDAVFCANMIHIAPFEACEGLIAGAGRVLRPGGVMFLYGPFARHGEIAPSNARFDADLKRRDPSWGVRDLDQQIVPLATAAGLTLHRVIEMPANNLSVVFRKT